MPPESDHQTPSGEADISRLYAEVTGSDPAPGPEGPAQAADGLLEDVLDGLLTDDGFSFDEDTVKANLAEILLSLVAHRSAETNGKRLMEDLSRVFDADLSPGTVYPQLHDATEAGLLERHELVRTKEYHVSDEAAVRERIGEQMRQHLVLGLFYYRAVEEF
jgi:hypothetical protein